MFYIIEIGTDMDGKVAKVIHEKEKQVDAEMTFYQTLASAMANDKVKSMLCVVMKGNGVEVVKEYWERAKGEET